MTDAGPVATGGITVSLGVKADLGFIGAGGGGTVLNVGYSKSQGFSISLTGTAEVQAVTGPTGGVAGILQVTSLPSVKDLNGPFLSLGKTIQPPLPFFVGAEGVATQSGSPVGFTLFGGLGFKGVPGWPLVTQFTYSTTSTILGWGSRQGNISLTDR